MSFKKGDRVKLVHMNDPYRKDIPVGVEGTVLDDFSYRKNGLNVLNVRWDDGFGLNPVIGVDIVVKISD